MGIQQVITYKMIDDMDGQELELTEKPEPVVLVYGDMGYKLYLSDANRKKLDTYLQKILKDAETFDPAPAAGRASGQVNELQQWLTDQGIGREEVASWGKQHGYEVMERGRLKANLIEAYKKDKEGTK